MKKHPATLILMAMLGMLGADVHAQQMLTGDTRLACEAILCLSSGTRPGECSPSLSRYYGIHKRKFSDTIRARLNFLQLCPVSSQTPEMQSLVSAIARGAGRCDAASLNSTLVFWGGDGGSPYIDSRMPDYCAAYTGHSYTDFSSSGALPRYVGTEQRGGYWVEARDHAQALDAYNARIKAEDATRLPSSGWGH